MELVNKEEIRQKADQITNKLFEVINKETSDDNLESPEQSLYLLVHIAAILNAKVSIATEGFGKTYNIEKVDRATIFELIKSLAQTYLHILESKSNS